MKRLAPLLAAVLAAALALPPASAAFAQTEPWVLVRLGETYVEGRYWPTGMPVTATLRNRQGKLKGQCTSMPGNCGDGYSQFPCWGCGFDQGVAAGSTPVPHIRPGDTISVEQNGVTTTSPRLADVEVTDVDVQADTVSGVVTPPRKQSFVRIQPSGRPTPTGWLNEPPYELTGKIAADGSFTIDTTGTGNLRRRDWGWAGYATGPFRVVKQFQAPSLQVNLDEPGFWFGGLYGAQYTLQLLDRAGEVKSEMQFQMRYQQYLNAQPPAAAAATPVSQGYQFAFVGSYNRPIKIREGDRIRVLGPGGFTLDVPKLRIDFLDAALGVRTRKNQTYEASASNSTNGYGWYGQTDAAGYDEHALPIAPTNAWARVLVNGCWVETRRVKIPD